MQNNKINCRHGYRACTWLVTIECWPAEAIWRVLIKIYVLSVQFSSVASKQCPK